MAIIDDCLSSLKSWTQENPATLRLKKKTQQQKLSLTVQALYHQDLMPSEASHQLSWDQEYASWI